MVQDCPWKPSVISQDQGHRVLVVDCVAMPNIYLFPSSLPWCSCWEQCSFPGARPHVQNAEGAKDKVARTLAAVMQISKKVLKSTVPTRLRCPPLVFQLCQPLLLSSEIIFKKTTAYCTKRCKAKEEHCVQRSGWCSSLFQQPAQFQLKKNSSF